MKIRKFSFAYHCPCCGAEYQYYDTDINEHSFIQECGRCGKTVEINYVYDEKMNTVPLKTETAGM